MTEHRLRRAVFILVGLTVLYLMMDIFTGAGGQDASQLMEGLLHDVRGEDVSTVRIVSRDESTVLLQEGGRWTVNGFDADSAALLRLWEAFAQASVATLVSHNPDNHPRLGVTPDSAWTITLDGDLTLFVGNAGNQLRTTYLRRDGTDETYLVRGGLRSAVTRTVFDWRNKVVLAIDTSAVRRIEIQREGSLYQLDREEGAAWMLDGVNADSRVMTGLLQELAELVVTGFASTDDKLGDEDYRSMTAYDGTGNQLASLRIAMASGTMQGQRPESAVLFDIPVWRADRIAPTRSEILLDGS